MILLPARAVQDEWDEEKEPEGFHLVGAVPTAQQTGAGNGQSLHKPLLSDVFAQNALLERRIPRELSYRDLILSASLTASEVCSRENLLSSEASCRSSSSRRRGGLR